MRGASLLLLSTLTASVQAETVIVNRSVNHGRIDIGPNAHTGSIVIDGNRVESSGTRQASPAEATEAKARVAKQLDQARQRVIDQLNRLQGKP
ncbi:MAG: hypothetical protein FIA97_08240 [Methylococcaceae bacterium]|nr:hypothetical protein [Methylococcaceae bacterium]